MSVRILPRYTEYFVHTYLPSSPPSYLVGTRLVKWTY
ncbi:hypothetical protein PoMZ_02001 [Pyricularia oryzae]|uniref:Uncharacterized protein n=1 Tax=Pyricularia oryzae TaxID=318829 RepID=A0A4P7NA91_PYROR|nr:hypothetical protein PoMZ_02001 [Pyricularia oryzae]